MEQNLVSQTAKDLIRNAVEFLGGVTSIVVKSKDQYDNAVSLCKQIKGISKSLDEERDALVRPLNTQVKEINEEFKKVTVKLDNGERQIKSAMTAWTMEEDRKRREAQRLLDLKADQDRRDAEAKADAERKKAQDYAAQGRLDMAEKAEARAEMHVEKAATIVAPVVEQEKTAGVSYRTEYQVTLVNKAVAVGYLLANGDLESAVVVDLKLIKSLAEKTKGLMKIPGVSYLETKVPIIRAFR